MARALVAIVVLLVLARPAAAELDGAARLTTGVGFDTNASRDFLEVGTDTDAMALLMLSLQGRYVSPRLSLTGTYDGGGRKFFRLETEDVLAQAAAVDAALYLAGAWTCGLEARVKDRRGTDRSYSDLWGSAYLSFVPDPHVDLKLYAAGHRFLYWPSFGYSFGAPEVGVVARYRFDARHQVFVFGETGARRYNQSARDLCDPAFPCPPTSSRRRHDSALLAGGGYAYRARFSFGITYTFWQLDSNSYGETQVRHRLNMTAGFRLPFKLMLFAQAGLQLALYPDGIFLSPDQALLEDDESTNSASLRLVRTLTAFLDVEVRYALYQSRFLRLDASSNSFTYVRNVAWLGLTWRL